MPEPTMSLLSTDTSTCLQKRHLRIVILTDLYAMTSQKGFYWTHNEQLTRNRTEVYSQVLNDSSIRFRSGEYGGK